MDCTGKIVNASKDFLSRKFLLTIEINESSIAEALDSLLKVEKLSIQLKKWRAKRSNNANAYAWVLMQKIAEKIKSNKEAVYLECLKKYSKAFTHVLVNEEAVERMMNEFRTCVDLGVVNLKTPNGVIRNHQLQCYYGSSTFNTEEMSVFIDGIVSDCKDLGIETMTPEDLERMKNLWNQ